MSQSARAHLKNKRATEDFDILQVFDDAGGIFFGAAVKTAESGDSAVAALAKNQNIVRSWPMRQYKLEPPIGLKNYSAIADGGEYNIHGQTGVKALHERGILGEGVTIGVVDSGTDYRHPAVCLPKCFGGFRAQ